MACSAGLLIARRRPIRGASGRRFDALKASSAASDSDRAGAPGERYLYCDVRTYLRTEDRNVRQIP